MAGQYACPYCGGPIDKNAKSCRHCGSDELTGWSQDTYLDGIDLPDMDDYEELKEKEFGSSRRKKISIQTIVGAVVLAAMILLVVGSVIFR